MKLLCANHLFPWCVLSLNCLNCFASPGLVWEVSIKPQGKKNCVQVHFQQSREWLCMAQCFSIGQIMLIFFLIAMLHCKLLSTVSSSDMSFSTSPHHGNLHLQSFFSGSCPEFIQFHYSLSMHQWVPRVILLHPWVQGVFNSSDWMGTSTLGFQFGLGACFEVNFQAVPT